MKHFDSEKVWQIVFLQFYIENLYYIPILSKQSTDTLHNLRTFYLQTRENAVSISVSKFNNGGLLILVLSRLHIRDVWMKFCSK